MADAVAAHRRSAEMQYLEYRLVLEADHDGFDVIGAFHAGGKRIDAYTVREPDDDGMAVIGTPAASSRWTRSRPAGLRIRRAWTAWRQARAASRNGPSQRLPMKGEFQSRRPQL